MALTHETTLTVVGYVIGDMKLANYSIAFTANQLVEPETGWFLLNGSVVSQTTYPTLYAKYGSTFNTGGEGVGNFRLPDLTDGKVPITKGLTNFTTYGAAGGEINHTITTSELYSHVHGDTFSATAASHGHTGSASVSAGGGSHTHTGNSVALGTPGYGTGGGISDSFDQGLASPSSSPAVTHTHSASTSIGNTTSPNLTVGGGVSAAGGGGSHNNMQPYLVMGGWLVRHG